MRHWVAVALLAGLAASAAAQSRYSRAAGPFAVYGVPPAIAAGRCDRGNGAAPPVAGTFGDPADRACLGLVLEYANDRQWVNWSTGREDVSVTPMRTYESDSGFCRDFLAITGGGAGPAMRTACRDEKGIWNLTVAPPPLFRSPGG